MSHNIVWHLHPVNREIRAERKFQKPLVIWFTGLIIVVHPYFQRLIDFP
jgi:hypothetical protein